MDQATKAYGRPFFLHNDGMAIRTFQNIVNEEGDNRGDVARNPDQFTLYRIGEFNDSNGEITKETPTSLGNGKSFENPKEALQIFKLLEEIREMIKEKK